MEKGYPSSDTSQELARSLDDILHAPYAPVARPDLGRGLTTRRRTWPCDARKRLYEAIAARDVEKGERTLRQHLKGYGRQLLHVLSNLERSIGKANSDRGAARIALVQGGQAVAARQAARVVSGSLMRRTDAMAGMAALNPDITGHRLKVVAARTLHAAL